MVELIAKKRVGRTKPGGMLRVTAQEARALVALQLAEVPPKPAKAAPAPKKGTYQRRDMVADPSAPSVQPMLPPVVTKATDDDGEAQA